MVRGTSPASSSKAANLRRTLYAQLDPRARQTKGLSATNRILVLLIVAATTLAVIETEPTVAAGHILLFERIELGFGLLFTLEYIARLWIAPEARPDLHPAIARLRFMASPAAVTDLLAIIGSLSSILGAGSLLLRLVRLLRILRLAKLGRMSRAFQHMVEAVRSRREELALSLCAGIFLMVVSATLLYLVEGHVQPDKFGSIPRALWWSVATLTTIGYGDAYPITALGKFLAGVTAVLGIGLIAMPTGILASAFSDAMQRRRDPGDGQQP
jgi:voltage-gated potassium channel